MLDPTRCVDLTARTKEEALREMVRVIATSPAVQDVNELWMKVIERERSAPTGFGIGVALPHALLPGVSDMVIAVGRSVAGIDFHSLDKVPVHIIVMIVANDSQSADLLKLMAKIVRRLRERTIRSEILHARTQAEICALLFPPAAAGDTTGASI